MAEWRFLLRWSEAELGERLDRLRQLLPNFSPAEEMTPRQGWNLTHSHALIAREATGPPARGGAFERLAHALERFHHSDPRIVVAHFRADAPLTGRRQLLELRALGLGFLCPVEIGETRDAAGPVASQRGFALDTLEGHIERGREWFLVDKDHFTGEIRFRIEAAWRDGDFPTWWSRIGFWLVGRRYQRAWHRLAHLRLRRIAAGLDPDEIRGPEGIVHEGPPIPAEPVQFFAQRGIGRLGIDVEREKEDMRPDRLWRALGLGALSGMRSAGAPAVLATTLELRGKDVISGRKLPFRLGRTLSLFAAGEMVADKMPFTPPRTQLPAVVARMASGAFVGSVAARKGESKWAPALLGAAAALASTWASFHLRRLGGARSEPLGYVVAFAEDALVIWAGARLGRATARATAS